MISANELRIGNWVTNQESPNQVYAIQFLDSQMNPYRLQLSNLRSKMGVSLLDVQPIPLTPEVLEKCGFVKDDFWWGDGISYYGNKVLDVRFGNEEVADVFDVVFYGQQEMPVKYLHQLQNLFYSLTGEELTVNL